MEKKDVYELTNPQKSIWLTEQYYKETNINTICGTIFFEENVDVNLLQETIKIFVKTNESMRTRIIVEDGVPQQFISNEETSNIEIFNLKDKGELSKLEKEISKTHFNIINSQLFIFKIFKLKNGNGGIIGHLHHLIADAWAFGIMSRELKNIYESLLLTGKYEENIPSYLEYIDKEKDYLNSDKFIKDKEYWESGFIKTPDLATIKPYDNLEDNTKSNRYTASLDKALCNKINEYAKKHGSSAYSFMMAVYSIYLSVVSGIDSIIIGTPFLNRSNFKEKNTMGMFVNTLPNKLDIDWNLKFSEYLQYTTNEQRNMFRHSKYPYDKLLEKIRKEQDLNRSLYDIAISYQNARNDSQESNINYHTYWNYCGNIAESMEIHVFDMDNTGSLQLFYDYQVAKFTEDEVSKIHNRILNIINQVLEKDLIIKNIEVVTPEEKQQLLVDFNNTKTDYPRNKTIAQVFEEQVKLNPNKPAIVFENETITYKEFNENINKLANYLEETGVEAKDKVVILAEKSIDLYVAIMAILKIGALYVPVDIEYPKERIKLILDDCNPKCVIIDEKYSDLINSQNKCTLPLKNIDNYSDQNLKCTITAEDGAYIIYTSGSTGKPKGVVVPNRGVVRLVKNTNYIEFKENDRILQNIAVVFDASTFAIFGSLLNGLTMYPINKDKLLDFEYLENYIKENDINIINLTVSLFNKLIEYNPKIFSKTRSVLIGGEQVLPKTVNIFMQNNPNSEIVNVYGPTENSNLSCCHIIKKEYTKSIPIGIPVSNSTCYVLSKNMQLLPIGIHGELYVGGDGVAIEYLNNKALTNEKFIPNIFGKGKLYKTGDLCYFDENGVVQFISRIDKQVKIRGFRIELKEIETKILEFGNIKECAVIIFERNDNKFLAAYVVAKNDFNTKKLNKYLKDNLPAYMVPSKIICIDSLPLNVNGKLDTKALPSPDLDDLDKDVVLPRDETEKAIVNILEKTLNATNISVLDSIFDLGADSLSAISISNMLTQKFNTTVTVKDIFNNSIIEDLAIYISKQKNKLSNNIQKAEKSKYYPASNAQKRIYYSYAIDNNSTLYNTAGGIIVDKYLDTTKLENCFRQLVKRHDSLRTHFEIIDNEVVQIIDNIINFNLTVEKSSTEDLNSIYADFVKPFNLEDAPLFRVKAVKLSNKKMLLLLDMHHIITDGTSLQVLLQELCDLYNDKSLPKKEIDYKDFSVWEKEQVKSKEYKKAKEYWVNQYNNEIPLLNMPTSYARPYVQSFEGANYYTNLPTDIFEKINETVKKLNITPYMLMLSCYYILLSKYTSQDDIVIGTPIAARELPELSNMVGMFVNTLPLRNIVDHTISFNAFANIIKNYCLEAFENQNYPFNELVKELNIKRDISRNPLFDVMFVYQNNGYPEINFDNYNVQYFMPDSGKSKFDLSLEVVPYNNEFKLRFEYCTKLFNKDFVERMAGHYINILNSVLNNIDIKISEIEIITIAEKNQIINEFNNTKVAYPNTTAIDLFEKQVKQNPNKIALIFEGKKLTYNELNQKANQLAHLISKENLSPESVICILLDKSIEMIIAILAILKNRCAYLPIDISYPRERIEYIMKDSNSKLLLTSRNIDTANVSIKSIYIDLDNKNTYNLECIDNLNIKGKSTDLAYVMYTSGSTGNPKGVMIENKSIIRLIINNNYIKFNENDHILQTGSIVFDACTFEIWGAFFNGLPLYIIKKENLLDSSLLHEYILKNKITILWLTAPLFNQLCEENPHMFRTVRCLLTGGDVLSPKHINMVRTANPNLIVINGYGPTENTTFSCCYNIKNQYESSIPIGYPISNSTCYVVSKTQNLQPIDIPGELLVGGDGLARGYLNNTDLTKEKFIYSSKLKSLVYKTGDLVKWNKDGTLQFLGRMDNQIKIRGFRVELSEINTVINTFEGIKESYSIFETIKNTKSICSYIVSDNEINIQELKKYLRTKLPKYMIPKYFMQISSLPINQNGKVNKKLLPLNFNLNIDTEEILLPENKTEQDIYKIFENVLNISNFSITDNFFNIGGDSITAMKLQIESLKNNYNITYGDIFKYPTVQELAHYIKKKSVSKNKTKTVSYDYDDILSKNNLKDISNNNLDFTPIGNVLLTGVTGFLGSHILDSYIKKTNGKIYCLIRQKNNILPKERLKNTLEFYFDKKYNNLLGRRIICIEGDITQENLGLQQHEYEKLGNNIDTVIHSAALVKHFGNYEEFKKININGTKNLINFSKTFKCRLMHISTISVSGNNFAEGSFVENNIKKEINYDETNFYVGQNLENLYVKSKFLAEQSVLDAIRDGLECYILRMGNLTSRYSEGKFQQNHFENAFVNRIKSLLEIGAIPDYILNGYAEFTPIDYCGDAIIDLANHYNKNFSVFHLLNEKHVELKDLCNIIKKLGIKFKIVNEEEFNLIIDNLLQKEDGSNVISGIIRDFNNDRKLVYDSNIKIKSDFTKEFLKSIGFEWPVIDINYLRNYLKYLSDIGYLNIKLKEI